MLRQSRLRSAGVGFRAQVHGTRGRRLESRGPALRPVEWIFAVRRRQLDRAL